MDRQSPGAARGFGSIGPHYNASKADSRAYSRLRPARDEIRKLRQRVRPVAHRDRHDGRQGRSCERPNIGAFILGNAIGAALGGAVLGAGLGYPVSLAGAAMTASALTLILLPKRRTERLACPVA
jgi:hypothetical protein